MFNGATIKKKNDQLFRFANDSIDMSAKEYFLTFFETLPSQMYFEEISAKIIKDLENKGWKKVFYADSYDHVKLSKAFSPSEPIYEKTSTYWVKKDFFMKVALHSRGQKCNISLSFPYDKPESEVRGEVDYVAGFVDASKDSKFYILVKDEYSLNIRDFKVKVPENVDLNLNYGDGFAEIHESIKKKISTEDSGLFVLHGAPGCGKSTYIKKLAEEIPDKKFVYIPEFMINLLNSPETINLFIEHQSSVLVIEDAEKIIMSREQDASSMVSIILNLSDGILSDILKIPIILTYNTKTENIDDALLRKGRLKFKHEFKLLALSKVVSILKNNGTTDEEIEALKKDGKIKENMSIAEVFFLTENNGVVNNKKEDKPKFGFGANA